MEDEIVIFSNQNYQQKAKAEDLLSYKWVVEILNQTLDYFLKVFRKSKIS